MAKTPILITIDLEEFDIPQEYGQTLDWTTQCHITNQGLDCLLPILKKHNVAATFFTTAAYATAQPERLRAIAQHHEIASHALNHTQFADADYAASKSILENIIGKPISGFRMPRLKPVNFELLQKAGYLYDASLNPTWLPGRYNKLSSPKTPFFNGQVHIIPSSVTPILRIPLFWLSFKNLPNWINCKLFDAIQKNGLFVFYIHPWEFADISHYKLPSYVKRINGAQLANKLDAFLAYISANGTFTTCSAYIHNTLQ
jgi:peptidoglycan/xylan/chitin deacetylase (PgdA/CDA1 family)